MEKFQTRILHENTVYLPLADCAKALDMSEDALRLCAETTLIPGVGGCLSETAYNRVLLEKQPEATTAVEVTSFDTVGAAAEALVKMIPLKLLLGGFALANKALSVGMDAVDYLWRVDLPQCFEQEKKHVLCAKGIEEKIRGYQDALEAGLAAIGQAPYTKFGLALQHMCVLGPETVQLHSYWAGEGIFWETQPDFMSNDQWDAAERFPNGTIRVPSSDYKEGYFDLVPEVQRDFRAYRPSENILYCLGNVPASQEWTDTITLQRGGVNLSVGIPLLIMMLNPDNCPNHYLFDDIPHLVTLNGNRNAGEASSEGGK